MKLIYILFFALAPVFNAIAVEGLETVSAVNCFPNGAGFQVEFKIVNASEKPIKDWRKWINDKELAVSLYKLSEKRVKLVTHSFQPYLLHIDSDGVWGIIPPEKGKDYFLEVEGSAGCVASFYFADASIDGELFQIEEEGTYEIECTIGKEDELAFLIVRVEVRKIMGDLRPVIVLRESEPSDKSQK